MLKTIQDNRWMQLITKIILFILAVLAIQLASKCANAQGYYYGPVVPYGGYGSPMQRYDYSDRRYGGGFYEGRPSWRSAPYPNSGYSPNYGLPNNYRTPLHRYDYEPGTYGVMPYYR